MAIQVGAPASIADRTGDSRRACGRRLEAERRCERLLTVCRSELTLATGSRLHFLRQSAIFSCCDEWHLHCLHRVGSYWPRTIWAVYAGRPAGGQRRGAANLDIRRRLVPGRSFLNGTPATACSESEPFGCTLQQLRIGPPRIHSSSTSRAVGSLQTTRRELGRLVQDDVPARPRDPRVDIRRAWFPLEQTAARR